MYIYNFYYNFTTGITFLTNIILIITKLYESNYTASQSNKKKYALSAYIREHLNFNTIDDNYIYKSDIYDNDNVDFSDNDKDYNNYLEDCQNFNNNDDYIDV